MAIAWLTNPGGLAEPFAEAYSDAETWIVDSQKANVVLRCPWADRYNVFFNIIDNAKEWPYLPGCDIRAMNGTIGPAPGSATSDNGSGNNYVDAHLAINFEWSKVKPNAPGGGTAIYSENMEPTAEFLTVPYQDFRWGSATGDALKKEEAPGRLEIGMDYVVSWNGLQSIPSAALTLIGCVNNAAVTSPSLGLTFAAETLLFNPPKISRTVSTSGTNKFQMVTRLTYRRGGWNTFWRAKTATFSRIYHKDGGATPYNNFQLASLSGVLP